MKWVSFLFRGLVTRMIERSPSICLTEFAVLPKWSNICRKALCGMVCRGTLQNAWHGWHPLACQTNVLFSLCDHLFTPFSSRDLPDHFYGDDLHISDIDCGCLEAAPLQPSPDKGPRLGSYHCASWTWLHCQVSMQQIQIGSNQISAPERDSGWRGRRLLAAGQWEHEWRTEESAVQFALPPLHPSV